MRREINNLSRILAVLFFYDGKGVSYIPQQLEDYKPILEDKMLLLSGRTEASMIAKNYTNDPRKTLDLMKMSNLLTSPPDEIENIWFYYFQADPDISIIFATLQRFAQNEEKMKKVVKDLLILFNEKDGRISKEDIKSILQRYPMD